MRRAVLNWGGIVILLAALLVSGCSSSHDPLDETGWRYRISSVKVFDGSEERHEIDPTAEGSASVQIEIESREDFDYDLYIHEVVCDITLTGDSEGSTPVTSTITYSPNGWVDRNGGTLTLNLIVFTAGEKQAVVNELGADLTGYYADFTVDITVHGSYTIEDDDNQISIEDSTWFTVIQASASPTPTPAP
jgi:hypothetical protein